MGSVRSDNQYKRIKEKRRQALEKGRKVGERRNLIKKLLISFAALALIAVFVVSGIFISEKIKDSGWLLRRRIALSTDSGSVDCAMLSVYMYQYYNDYVNVNTDSMGFDPTIPLKEQSYSSDGTTSWFDYFMGKAKEDASKYLSLEESAIAADYSLTSAQIEAVTEKVNTLNLSDYGRGVNKEDLQRAFELSTLALSYEAELKNSCLPSDEEIDAKYSESKNDYCTVSFRSYSVVYTDSDSSDSDDKSDNLESIYHYPDKDNAKLHADDLALCENEDNFVSWVSRYTSLVIEGTNPEDVENSVKKTENFAYKKNDSFSEWAFSSDRSVCDTYVYEDNLNSCYTVYMLTETAHRDETPTVNVRHIMLMTEYCGLGDEGMNILLEEIRSKFESGDRTSEAFSLLALQYSNDNDSAYNGGLYENLVRGTMPEEFEKWCFDSSRKAGDLEIVRTTYGWHLMCYEGEGVQTWRAQIARDIAESAYEEKYTGITSLYKVDTNENNIDQIPE